MSLGELREFFAGRGYGFLCLTDHSQNVNAAQFALLTRNCRELSAADFVFVPGLEYSCDGQLHIMGLGIEAVTTETDPRVVIEHIHASGGIAVLAHPTKKDYIFAPEWIGLLDGMEIWNVSNDGKFLPQFSSVRMFLKFQAAYPHLRAFFGIDFHSAQGYYETAIRLAGTNSHPADIMRALRAGEYVCASRWLSCSAHPRWSCWRIGALWLLRTLLNGVRLARNTVTAWLPTRQQSCI